MEQVVYERPRERLRNRGVSFLTTVELLQIIIGSGTAAASGARLAKRINTLLVNETPSFSKLCQIEGIGVAKASQILAALELGRRHVCNKGSAGASIDTVLLSKRVGAYRERVLSTYFYDGNHRQLHDSVYPVKKYGAAYLSQQVARDALECNARSVILCLGFRHDTLVTNVFELDLIKHCKASLGILSIQLTRVYRANATKVENWADL